MPSIRRGVAVAALALAELSSAHARQATAPRTMHVEGRVVDALSGQPLRGVVVIANVFQGSTSISPAAAFLTAADGRFVFRDLPLGSVGLLATKVGFLNGELKPFTVPTARKDDVRVPLIPEGLISGRVVDQFAEPVANARVKAVLQANAPVGEPGNLLRGATVVSDDAGRFLIGGLEAGLYLLMVEGASGRTPRSHDQVFFPASLTADTATAIEVTAGAEHAGADMMVTVTPGSVDAGFGFPRPVPAAPATGSVSGLVRDTSGRGLSHAVVVMRRPGIGAELRTMLTDEAGRFEFDRVPAGRLQFIAARDGYYSPGTTPLTTPPPAEIDVGPGQRQSGVVLTLSRAQTLDGRLLDQFGDPIAGSISLRLAKTPAALRYLASANTRGQFRIANIVPGEYVLFVDPNPVGRDQRLVGQFRSVDVVPGEYKVFVDQAPFGRDLRISEDPDHERTVAMLPMYYPGVSEASMATPIIISPGADVTGIDFIVRPEPVTTIEVMIDAPALELQSFGITRYSLDHPAAPVVRGTMLPGARQGYVSSTKAGRYLIVVAARESPGPAGPARPELGYGSNFWGSAEVSSDGVTPSSVTIALEPSARVSGTVVFEGRLAPQLVNPGLVSLDPLRGRDVFMNAALDKMNAGRSFFTIGQIQPGRYLFRLMGSRGAEAKPTWVVKSIVADGRDALDRPIDLAPGADLSNVVITLSDQISEVSGTVTHDRAAHPQIIVMTFSPDPQQWVRGSMRIASTSVGADGRYSLRGLPAGDYRLAAYDPADAPAADDLPLLLKKLLPASVAITIRLGETRTQDLAVK